MTDCERLLGVVLCGGKSSRMGRDKSLLQLADGTSFLEHAIGRIAPVCDSVGISCQGSIETECLLIQDPLANQGPVVGMAASLRFARQHSFQACLFTPIDMPHLTTNDLLNVKHAWQQSKCLTVAKSDRIQPLVGIYPIGLLEEIDRLAASNDRSLTKWIKSQDCASIPLSEAACHNVNTPEDLSHGT